MRASLIFLVAVAMAAGPMVTAQSVDELVEQNLGPTRYTVGFYGLPRDLEPGDDYNGGKVVRVDSVLHFAAVETTMPALFEARTTLDDNVRYVEATPWMQLIQFTPNDPRYPSMYGPQQIGAPAAWDTTLGTTAVTVCVGDTGVRYTHEDLTGTRWAGGTDIVNGDSDPMDDNGHGTHVTGTAAASTNNGLGVAGIAQAAFKHAKVLNSAGSGTWDGVASGIRWCADNGGFVISLSLGGSAGATVLEDAVNYAWGAGSVVVAAAGNSGPCTNCVGYPAKYANAIAVTCTTSSKAQCSFSSEGPEADLAAPGNGIDSTWYTSNTAYNSISGTSMSTPHVAGAAALVKSANTALTNADVRSRLESCVEDLGPAGTDTDFGKGLVRPDLAIGSCAPPPPPGCSGGPANNCFASSQSLTSPASVTVSTSGATMESGEPAPCGSIGATVWYHFTAAASGTAVVDTVGGSTNYDTVLAAYTGSSLTGLTNLACNDDYSALQSRITFSCTAGTTYRIQLGGYQAATGTATLDLTGCTAASGPVLDENFDDGVANGWTNSGLWRVGSNCVTAASAPNTLQYNSASSCTYSTGARTTGNAQTPGLNIASISAPTLTFSTRYTKENYAGGAYDIMRVQASTNAGSTWTTLWQRDSRNADQLSYTTVSLGLSSYKTTSTLIRFNFDSVDSVSNSYLGWVVDNVKVQ